MNLAYPLGKKTLIRQKYKEGEHYGIDIGATVGTDVISIADGTIVRADNNNKDGYGNFMCVKHPNLDGKTLYSCYAHLSKFSKNIGDEVKKGEVIGKSGGEKGAYGSGNSSGPHLHFEIRETLINCCLDPEKYITTGTINVVPTSDKKSEKEKIDVEPEDQGSNVSVSLEKLDKLKTLVAKYAKEYDAGSEEMKTMAEEVNRIKDIMKKIL